MATPVTPGGKAKHCDGCRDPANCKGVSDQCGVCNKPINETTGKPIVCGGKQFHRSCFECKGCHKRLQPGWMIVHPVGLFCKDICVQSELEMACRMPYEPSRNYAKPYISNGCIICTLPVDEEHLETWIICAGIKIHQQCFKCETCATSPPPPDGEVIVCAKRFWCNDNCLRNSNEKAVKVYCQPDRVTDATKEAEDAARGGNDDPVNGENVNDRCGVCNKPINEVPGEQSISCGEKQFHQSCFKCQDCDTRLKPGWILMHPDGGLFCSDTYGACIRRLGIRAMQVSYKPSCNDDNNSNVNNNCLVCNTPVNKEHLVTSVNCSGSIIHRECFKCKACVATPPPKGEIKALKTWFFCDDDCIRSFGETAIEVYCQPARVTDATKEDEMRGANEGKKMHRGPSPPRVVKQPPAEERSSRKKPPK